MSIIIHQFNSMQLSCFPSFLDCRIACFEIVDVITTSFETTGRMTLNIFSQKHKTRVLCHETVTFCLRTTIMEVKCHKIE